MFYQVFFLLGPIAMIMVMCKSNWVKFNVDVINLMWNLQDFKLIKWIILNILK